MTRLNGWGLAALTLTLATAACGGSGDALGLKHKVSEKELVGLDTEATLRLDAQRAEVSRLEDVYRNADFEQRNIDANLKSSSQQTEEAKKAIEAANDKIEATRGSEAKDLEQAKAKYQREQAELKQRHEQEARAIRERYKGMQEQNRSVLDTAKGGKALADAQAAVHKAQAAEHKAAKQVKLQELRVSKARFEVSRLDEAMKLKAVVGKAEQERKKEFDGQLAAEEKKLAAAQAELAKKQEALKLALGRLEQEKGRAQR